MLKKLLVTTMLAMAPVAAQAQAPQELVMTALQDMPAGLYNLDPTHASLTFRVNHMGLSNYTARFTHIDASLKLDPIDPTRSTLVVKVDPNSLRTDYPYPTQTDFDGELARGKTWLNATKFPEISYKATSIEKLDESTGVVKGDLTFMGLTRALNLNVTFNGAYAKKPMSNTPGIGFSATAIMKRSDWGLSTGIPMVGDDVVLMIEAEFNKAS
jgi:polyisoprenoid-binding protein YceI